MGSDSFQVWRHVSEFPIIRMNPYLRPSSDWTLYDHKAAIFKTLVATIFGQIEGKRVRGGRIEGRGAGDRYIVIRKVGRVRSRSLGFTCFGILCIPRYHAMEPRYSKALIPRQFGSFLLRRWIQEYGQSWALSLHMYSIGISRDRV